MLADWKKAGGLGPALKWFKVMTSDLMAKDDSGTLHTDSVVVRVIYRLTLHNRARREGNAAASRVPCRL